MMVRELSSRVTVQGNMLHVIGYSTPKGHEPLIGSATITVMPAANLTPTQTVVELVKSLPVELRLHTLGLPLPDLPEGFALAAE